MRRTLRLSMLLAVAASLTACLTACRSKPAVPNGLFHVVLQTDWYPQPEHGGFYEAQLDGLYKAQGLEVEIVPGGPTVIGGQQIATGAAQFGMGSSDTVLVDNAHGVPEVAVAATMQQDPQAVMVHADSPVHSFADLDGRTIAAKPGSIWLEYLIQRYNLKNLRQIPATFSIANFVTDPQYIQQCFVTSEPYFAEKAGSPVRTLLISSTDYQPYRVFFTSRQFLADHPEIVRKFVAASLEGWKRYLAEPAKVDAELGKLNPAMSAAQMKFSVDTLKAGHFIDGQGTAESHLGHMEPARWDTIYRQLMELKVLPHALDPGTVYTTEFAP